MGEAAARRWDDLAREWRRDWPGRGLHRTYAESTLNFPRNGEKRKWDRWVGQGRTGHGLNKKGEVVFEGVA